MILKFIVNKYYYYYYMDPVSPLPSNMRQKFISKKKLKFFQWKFLWKNASGGGGLKGYSMSSGSRPVALKIFLWYYSLPKTS